MTSPLHSETDNEVARAIIRRRDRLYVLPHSPFEDCKVAFDDGIRTYYIEHNGQSFHTGDHWDRHHDYFRPAPHLMNAISDLVREASEHQNERDHRAMAKKIVGGVRP
jgi:hypothetical protein